MSDYTVDMFCVDHDRLLPILQAVEGIELTESEWPKINIEGTIYALNPNFPEVDTIRFFTEKYGKKQGFDYAVRFLEIIRFINKHRKKLIRDQLVKTAGSHSEVVEELLQVMLDSFSPAQSPVIFPKSTLQSKSGELNYTKVLKATKSIMKE